jgi:hypothetical protein
MVTALPPFLHSKEVTSLTATEYTTTRTKTFITEPGDALSSSKSSVTIAAKQQEGADTAVDW